MPKAALAPHHHPTTEEIEQHLRLVYKIAHNLRRLVMTSGYLEFSDLVNNGVLGLIYALQHFDPDKGFAFSDYAGRCIEGYVFRAHRDVFREQWLAQNRGEELEFWSFDSGEADAYSWVGDQGSQAQGLEENLEAQWLWKRAYSILTPPQREVVDLLRQGKTQVEVARTLGLSRNAIGLRYKHAVRRLRRLYQT